MYQTPYSLFIVLLLKADAPGRTRTYNQRIMLTTTAFAAPRAGGVSWSGLSLRFTRLPSSLYTFPAGAGLGSGLPSRFRGLGFPEFGRFYGRT